MVTTNICQTLFVMWSVLCALKSISHIVVMIHIDNYYKWEKKILTCVCNKRRLYTVQVFSSLKKGFPLQKLRRNYCLCGYRANLPVLSTLTVLRCNYLSSWTAFNFTWMVCCCTYWTKMSNANSLSNHKDAFSSCKSGASWYRHVYFRVGTFETIPSINHKQSWFTPAFHLHTAS